MLVTIKYLYAKCQPVFLAHINQIRDAAGDEVIKDTSFPVGKSESSSYTILKNTGFQNIICLYGSRCTRSAWTIYFRLSNWVFTSIPLCQKTKSLNQIKEFWLLTGTYLYKHIFIKLCSVGLISIRRFILR